MMPRLPVLYPLLFSCLLLSLLYLAPFVTVTPPYRRLTVRRRAVRRLTVRSPADPITDPNPTFLFFLFVCPFSRCIIVEFPEQKAPLL